MKTGMKELFSFKVDGVISRRLFWKIYLTYAALRFAIFGCISLFTQMMNIHKNDSSYVIILALTFVIFLISLIPSICLQIRRLHDVNIPGFSLLLVLLGLHIVNIAFYLLPSNHVNNRYVEKYLNLPPGSTCKSYNRNPLNQPMPNIQNHQYQQYQQSYQQSNYQNQNWQGQNYPNQSYQGQNYPNQNYQNLNYQGQKYKNQNYQGLNPDIK